MTAVRVPLFKGASMRTAPHLIPTERAQHAENARVDDGRLRAWSGLGSTVATLVKTPTIKSLYRWADTAWFHWKTDVDAVHGPIQADTEERTYFTGDGEPKMTYSGIATDGSGNDPAAAYRLGIPAPATAPSAAVSGTATNPSDVAESRAYVMTYVSAKGEEGPPSAASNIVEWRDGQTVDLTSLASAPTGNYNVTRKRIYRTASDGTSTDYFFVAEIDVALATYNDALDGSQLGEIVPSTDWIEPPDDLSGLIALPNGTMAAFSGRELLLCEPYIPHAWPLDYRYTVDDPIVAIGAIGTTIMIATEGTPYVAQATHPASVSLDKAESPYPCVSKRGAVDMGSAILFPGPDGLMAFAGREPVNITAGLIAPEDWQALVPTSMHAYRFENRYVAFYDTGVEQGGFMIDETGEQLTFLDLYADAGYVDPEDSTLYLVSTGTQNVVKFNEGSALSYTWRSKTFVTPKPLNAACIEVEADTYPVHVKVTADGVTRWEGDVANEQPQPLPPGLATRYVVELSGENPVRAFGLAESVEELRVQ